MPKFQVYQIDDLYSIKPHSEYQQSYVNIIDDSGISKIMKSTDVIEAPSLEDALSVWEQGITIANYLDQQSIKDNTYHRPLDGTLIGFGGQLVDSSNWASKKDHSQKTNGVSFSPTEVWLFPDNSMLEITCSSTRVMRN